MKKYLSRNGIPMLIQGEDSHKILLAVHGVMSNKEDTVIQMAAEHAINHGFQVVSMDLPEHGERTDQDKKKLLPWICAEEIRSIYDSIQDGTKEISLFACSLGAYVSMLALADKKVHAAFFLSPVLNMTCLVENLLTQLHITEEELEQKKLIKNPNGQDLSWEVYQYAKEHPIQWECETSILWGTQDNVTPESVLDVFSRQKQAKVTKVDSEHYFHTREQLRILDSWMNEWKL